jgi:gliding motility-associated-like protein
LTGTSAATCVNKDTVFLQVNQLPIVVATAPGDTICQGDTVMLHGNGATNYTWYVLGNSSSFSSIDSVPVNPNATTSYVLNGIDNNLCSNKDTIVISVNPAASVNGITGTLSLCPGVVGVSYWVNNPNPTSTYGWTILNGNLNSGQGNDSVFVDWPNPGPGNVTVIETTDHGCKSLPVVLPVNVNTILTPAAPTGNLALCANQASGQNYTAISTPGSTYNWFAQGGTVVSGNGTSAVTVDWNVAGPATVNLWYEETSITVDTVCFGVSDTLHVTINPVPVTSAIQGTSAICVLDSSNYSVTATSGSTYAWTVNGGSIVTGNGTSSIHVAWSTSGTNTVTVQETNSFACVGNPVNMNITVNALPIANAGTDATVCAGSSTNLNASGGINYTWSPATGLDNATISNPIATPAATTTYTVYVVDGNGCHNTDQVIVNVNALPIVSAGASTAICLGKSTTLNGTGGVTYAWSPATGLNDPSVASPVANPTATTTYSVIVTDANSCSNTASVTITVNPLPTANAGTDILICNGSNTTLNAIGGVSYQWSPSTGLSNPNIANPVANPTSTTTYTVTVTDINGCTDEDQVDISINNQPVANFSVDTALTKAGCDGVFISLINNSTNTLQYNWTFGDGGTSTDVNPTHTYNFGQNITITLIATNNLCADTLAIINPIGSLDDFIKNRPNVFSPNGDGLNDCFDLGKNTDFSECSNWLVFNRWGDKVFESSPTHQCWNGKKNSDGEDLPDGTYFYILTVKNGQFKGSLTLMR